MEGNMLPKFKDEEAFRKYLTRQRRKALASNTIVGLCKANKYNDLLCLLDEEAWEKQEADYQHR
jgi:hypothetical protein